MPLQGVYDELRHCKILTTHDAVSCKATEAADAIGRLNAGAWRFYVAMQIKIMQATYHAKADWWPQSAHSLLPCS